MPYIGNQAVVGDSANTFKLLDDISTFTLTFDGSSTDVVSVNNNTLTFANHRFITGQRVTYTDGGGTVITGLTDGTAYFIIKVDRSTIKLATNASNAASSTAIDLTGVGAGTSHTLNVAFDGVNTKFKATHTNGIKAGVSRAAQLSLSINGVIQQPTEAKPPTVGYGIEPDSTIVFSTAPVTTDKVFGSFIGEVAPSFDLTDNTVNNFTGDGSTSTFNLSKEIPSNNDILVTLDGVTQYPSDTSTTRAYSVIGSSLVFVSAPADGVAIQVRMIGFAGSTAAEVTGFYGRTGNVALKSTDDIAFQNASAGIITASKFVGELVGVVTATNLSVSGVATFSGDVGIAGTLTYEDVTNIDSVGIITARSNILVGSGITLSPDGDVFATGISTFSEGFAGDVLIDDKIVHRGDINTAIRFPDTDTFTVETDGKERLRINPSGRYLINTNPTGTGRQARLGPNNFNPLFQIETQENTAAIQVSRIQDVANPPRLVLQSARGTSASPSIAQNDDQTGQILFSAYDGSNFTNTAQIRSEVDGTPGTDDMPGNLIFGTTSDGSPNSSERLRINSSGQVLIGTATEATADVKLAVYGSGTTVFKVNNTDDGTATLTLANTGSSNGSISQSNSAMNFSIAGDDKLEISDNVVRVKNGQVYLNKQGAANFIKVGTGQNANNYAYIDFIGDDTYTGYGLRLLRGQGGANTDSMLTHRGTGSLFIKTVETAPIIFTSADTERMRITGTGNVGISTQSPTGKLSVGKVGAYLSNNGITVTNPHSLGLKNGVFVHSESGYNPSASYRAAAFKAVGTTGIAVGVSTDQGSNGLGGTLNYSLNFDGTTNQDGSITANGSFFQDQGGVTNGGQTQDKTITFDARGVFLLLISYSLGTTTSDINRNIYSLGLFVSRSNGATWVPIQQDLNSTQVGNLTISDNSVRGQLRVQKSAGTDNRSCAFRIDVLSSAGVKITVTDT